MNNTLIRWYIREEVDYHLDLTRENIISHLAHLPISDTENLADADEIRTMSDKELIEFLDNAWDIANTLPSAPDVTDVFAQWDDEANNNGDIQGSLRDFLIANSDPTSTVESLDMSADPTTLLHYGEEIESGRMELVNPHIMPAVNDLIAALDKDAAQNTLNESTTTAVQELRKALGLLVN